MRSLRHPRAGRLSSLPHRPERSASDGHAHAAVIVVKALPHYGAHRRATRGGDGTSARSRYGVTSLRGTIAMRINYQSRGNYMRRLLLLAAALAIPASGLSLALATGPASAASGPKGKTVCSSVAGTETGTVTISGCADSNGANTGGASTPIGTLSLGTGGTVTWVSGQTATFGASTLTPTSAKHCPGYVKGGTSNPAAEKFSGTVTASTAGFKIPGKYKGEVCIDSSGNITSPKPLKVS